MSFSIRERGTSYCLIRTPYRPYNFFNDDLKQKKEEVRRDVRTSKVQKQDKFKRD